MQFDEPAAAPGGPSSEGPARPEDDATVISTGAEGPRAEPASPAAIGTALQGTMLGPYRLDRFVGGGGMGAVFRAHDTTLDRIVAVKVLSRAQSADEDMLRRFRNEAQSAARLDHENIGRVHAVGSDRGWHYIVFEFIEGRNVRDLVRDEGPFTVGRAIDVAIQVAEALEHASERDVVHRDIKPSNIVITPAGRARVVDMGLARLAPAAGDADLTVSGMTLGTFDYISPEQARDPRAADVRSDLYSLGCTLFFMLAGRAPFAEGTMVQKLLQHQQDSPPAIRGIRPDVPERLAAILTRLMAKDPGDRYQRPAVLTADLVACAEENGIVLAAPRTVAAAPPARPVAAAWPWLVPVGGLLATVAALWIKAAVERRPSLESPVVPVVTGPLEVVREPVEPRVIRVGSGMGDPGSVETLAAALEIAAAGDVVELDFSGPRDVPPLRLEGRRLTLRAATGRSPTLRFTPDSAGGPVVVCDVGNGSLRLEGVTMLVSTSPDTACCMFALGAGSLAIEASSLEFRPDPGEAGAASDAPRAFVSTAFGSNGRTEVSMLRSRARGDAEFLAVAGGEPGTITVDWTDGEFVSPRRFLAVAGADRGPGEPLVECHLRRAVFACRDGLAVLRDSPSRPVVPRLAVVAEDCLFMIAAVPLVEQSGLGDPELYRAAVTWADRGSRFEGSDVFRRINGAAGSVSEGFSERQDFLRHSPHVEAWPEAATWGTVDD